MANWRRLLLFLLALVLCPVVASAQTASSALVSGTVFDKSGAVVPGATVELREPLTNTSYTATTDEQGQYLFSTVKPGNYRISVRKEGFKEWTTELKMSASKSYSPPIILEVGAKTEVMVVEATVGAEIQKTDATVGNVIGGDELKYLPTANRSVASLLTLQPLVIPISVGIGTDSGGQVAGARSDQNVFLIDGGDATSDTEGSGGYNTGFGGEQRPMIPVPAESIEEFRVGTTNPNATFGRSQGGQVVMVTKRGTNSIHGSAYWYHQNDNLNANSWDLRAVGRSRGELKDNRYGFTAGGPIFKDKLFFFGHYEARNFPQNQTFTRNVPTATFRQGQIIMNATTFNFNPALGALATGCQDPTFGGACDPRGIGVSSVTLADLNTLPLPSTPTIAGIGDGINIAGFRSTVSTKQTEKFALGRIDYRINDKWNFFASGRYQSFRKPGAQQIDVTGLSGCTAPCAIRVNPLQPRYYVAGVDGQITPHLLSETRVSWFRHWWEWGTRVPIPQVAGTAAALSLSGEGTGAGSGSGSKIADPYNIDTQNGRSRIWNGKDWYFNQNFTWLRGRHNFQFGGSYRYQDIFHQRTDKVTGGLSTGPIFYLDTRGGTNGAFVTMTSGTDTFRPAGLSGTNVRRWNAWYASLLGIVDKSAQVLTRDGSLKAQPLGTTLQQQTRIHAVEGFFQDIFRMTPHFTLTAGITYQVQRPPTEKLGRQMVPVFAADNNPIDMNAYYGNREAQAVQGNIFNPDIGFSPVRSIPGHKYVIRDIDWNNVGPRIAFAWNPSQHYWGMGDGKTVLRGGWAVTYTRMNGVGLVMTPVLGPGIGSVLACKGPQSPTTGTGTCFGSSNPTNAFRIGPDGNGTSILPGSPNAPIIPQLAIPFIPAAPNGETRGFSIDPGLKLGYAHSFDLTLQRELPWNLLVEVGYVGRLGRNLIQNVDFNAVPFMMKDPVSGQTLAQAFVNLQTQLGPAWVAGTAPGALTPQPWFENFGATACANDPQGLCQTFPSVTAYLGNIFQQEITLGDLATPMLTQGFGLDDLRRLCGLNAACVPGMQPIDNLQVQVNNLTSHRGLSNYHAGFIALHKRMSHGLTFDLNYTLSHSLDLFGINQENTQFSYTSPFRPDFDYEPSLFDRRHVFNFHWFYLLPFGKGQRWASNNNILDKVVGGWHFAGILTASSGQPLCPFNGNGAVNYGAPNAFACWSPVNGLNTVEASVRKGSTAGALQAFSNPSTLSDPNCVAVAILTCGQFRAPNMVTDGRFGFGSIRGLGRWNVDLSIGKSTSITERVKLTFVADFLNAFNHTIFNDPNTDVQDPGSFGVLNSQNNAVNGQSRYIQLGFRIDF